MELQRIASSEVKGRTVVMPTGSTEQHGPHLPLGTDALIAEGIARRVAEGLGADLAPVLSYGLSEHHMAFRGTVTVTPVNYVNIVLDILGSLARGGYRRIVIINGHGGNIGGLTTAVQELQRTEEGGKVEVFLFNWWSMRGVTFPDTEEDYHAGDAETSVALALGLELRGEPVDEMKRTPSGYRIRSMTEVTSSGVWGYPTKASREKGQRIVDIVVDHIVGSVGPVED